MSADERTELEAQRRQLSADITHAKQCLREATEAYRALVFRDEQLRARIAELDLKTGRGRNATPGC